MGIELMLKFENIKAKYAIKTRNKFRNTLRNEMRKKGKRYMKDSPKNCWIMLSTIFNFARKTLQWFVA